MPEFLCKTEPPSTAALDFVESVKSRQLDRISELLAHNSELASQVDSPWFAFDAPAIVQARNDREIVDLLLEAGANIDIRSDWDMGSYGVLDDTEPAMFEYLRSRGATLTIHAAVQHELFPEVDAFLTQETGPVQERGPDGQMPLHCVRSVEMAQRLLGAGAKIDARCLDHHSTAGQYLCVSEPEICRFLLSKGAWYDLFMASALGDLDLVRKVVTDDPDSLLEQIGKGRYVGAEGHGDIYKWKLGFGLRPHQVASKFGHTEVYDYLHSQLPECLSFLASCWEADRESTIAFLAERPDWVAQLNPDELRTLPDAAWDERLEAVGLMLEIGFPVDSLGDNQATALDRACVQGNLDLVEIILPYKPSFEVTNEFGGVPLGAAMWGATNGMRGDHMAVIKRLLLAGAGGNPKDAQESDRGLGVLLAWAASEGQAEMVEALRSHL